MTEIEKPNSDRLDGLPIIGLPKPMKAQLPRVGSYNEFLLKDNKQFAETLESDFLNTNLYEIKKSDLIQKQEKSYLGSEYRLKKYKEISEKDIEFNEYLKSLYGSDKNFFEANENMVLNKTYNPTTDYNSEVVIITEDNYFKSNFISQTETIFELLSGMCTIEYFKVNGTIGKITGTLSNNYVPDSQGKTRSDAFGGIGRGRVLVWDIINTRWVSFYMTNLVRFVRDETSELQ
jgi:hypothetical protein